MKNNNALRSKKDFERLFEKKTSYYSSFFIIHASKNNKSSFRFAISVNKKNFKKAVDRNKIKRQIRAIINEIKETNKGVDFLIIPKNNFLKIEFIKKKNDLLHLLNKNVFKI